MSGWNGRYKGKLVKSLARGGRKIGEEEICNRGHNEVILDLRSGIAISDIGDSLRQDLPGQARGSDDLHA